MSPKSKSPHDSNTLESPKANKSPSSSKSKSSEKEIIVIDDDDAADQGSSQGQSPKLMSPKEKPVYNWPDAALYQYEVRIHFERKDKGSKKKEKQQEAVIVKASAVRYHKVFIVLFLSASRNS